MSKSSLIERGNRLKQLREMCGLTQNAIEKKYGIKAGTQTIWENARRYGLSPKSAQTILKVFNQEGVICHLDWILHGKGLPPIKRMISNDSLRTNELLDDNDSIINEMHDFIQTHPGAIDFIMHDDSMSPVFQTGDYLIGMQLKDEKIEAAVGHDCIAQLASGEIVVRKIKSYDKSKGYTLSCYNESADQPYLYNVSLLSAAPICWHRKSLATLFDKLNKKS